MLGQPEPRLGHQTMATARLLIRPSFTWDSRIAINPGGRRGQSPSVPSTTIPTLNLIPASASSGSPQLPANRALYKFLLESVQHKAGEVSWGGPTKHKEENLSDKPFEALVVELKS